MHDISKTDWVESLLRKQTKLTNSKKKRKGKRFIHPENVKHQKPLTKNHQPKNFAFLTLKSQLDASPTRFEHTLTD